MRTISTRDVPRQPEPAASPHSRATKSRRAFTAWAAAASLAPLALYFLVRPVVGTDAIALAITAAVSVVFACAAAAARRRSGRAALLIAVGFALALAVTVVSGGSSLPFKLYRPATTGLLGLSCLISVALHRPLLLYVLRSAARRYPQARLALAQAQTPHGQAKLRRATVGIGLLFLAEAAITTVLALSLSTGAFLLASRAARLIGIAAGAGILSYFARRSTPTARAVAPSQTVGTTEGTIMHKPSKRSWFGPKRVGIGFRPQTWQGWLIIATVIITVIMVRFVFHIHHL